MRNLTKVLLMIFLALIIVPLVSADYKREIYDYEGSHLKEKVNYSVLNADTISGGNGTFTENVTASWFEGLFNWTLASDITSRLFSWTGSILTLSSPELNETVTEILHTNRTEGDVTFGQEISAENITSNEYFFGQPIEGGISNGIVWAAEIDGFGQLNLTHTSGLDLSYPSMIVRVVSTPDGVEKYCNITGDTVTVTDDSHKAYFVSATDCSIGIVGVDTFVNADVPQSGNIPIFHAMAHSGEIEAHQGMPILNRLYIRSRLLSLKTINLDVISGLTLIPESLLNFTITSGEYVFVDQPVDTTEQNLSDNAILEIFYRDGGDYQFDEYVGDTQTGLNLTSCEDASQDVITCSLQTRFRRYFLFVTGFDDGDDETEIHQRLASNAVTYTNLGDCLNTEENPISYDLPDFYTYTAVPLYAYCGQGTDTSLTGTFIDLRTIQTGQASAGIDTSIFITKDGTRDFTGNQSLGGYSLLNINYSCFNPACTSRMYDNGTDLIIERL